MRIYQYYLPVYYWCRQQLDLHRKEKGTSQPLIIGMQAPQVLRLCQSPMLTLVRLSGGPTALLSCCMRLGQSAFMCV